MDTAVQITMYLNESDKWQQILQMLRRENTAGASALHAMGGFNGRSQVHTSNLVDAGGDLPVIIVFVDAEEHVARVLPELRRLAPHRLIVRETVTIEQGSFD
jgi:PII-like signaling protein